MRKVPNLTAADITACLPIGLCMMIAHGGSVLAMGVGAVSFAQIVKACEPVFAAVVGLLLPPADVKPMLAYAMLIPIVGGVGLACVKEGKGVDINVEAFAYASIANVAAAFKVSLFFSNFLIFKTYFFLLTLSSIFVKGKLGGSVTKALKGDVNKNMDSANVYAVNNIISFFFTVPMVIYSESSSLQTEWAHACEKHGTNAVIMNIALSGLFFYIYNEFAFAFTASVGAVTSSVLNTAKRVIIIVVSAIIFNEAMERNTVIGSGIAITGTFLYSLASHSSHHEAPKKKTA